MPVEDLIHHVNLTGLAGEGSLYQAGDHVAAWFGGLHLHSLFEPVADLEREQIVGHIAHLSAHDADGQAVPTVDAYARLETNAAVIQFDRLSRTLHALNFLAQRQWAGGFLQLAVHPRHLSAVRQNHGLVFEAILKRCGLAPEDILLDVRGSDLSAPAVQQALANYRQRGYRISAPWPHPAGVPIDQVVHDAGASAAGNTQTLPRRLANGLLHAGDLAIFRQAGFRLACGPLIGRPESRCRTTHSRL